MKLSTFVTFVFSFVLAASGAPRDDAVLHGGDMILTAKQKKLYGAAGDASFAGAGVTKEDIWPKGVIAYHFPWTMGGVEKKIFQAMDEWSAKTCIKFTQRGSQLHRSVGHGHYIIIKDEGGCFSSVGYSRKNVLFSLAKNGCMFKKTILHELGHIIGLHHEQSRKDRDRSLVIVYKNVSPSEYHNFDTKSDVNDIHIPYDYCSIMQYGPRSFSKTGGFTILTKNQDYQLSIGRSDSVSFYDAKMVNLMYDCNAACPKQPSCREPCYVDYNCRCACPPRDECAKSPCRDLRSASSCTRDRKRCFGRDPDFDLECAETCGHCAAARRILAGDESAIIDESSKSTPPPTEAPKTKCVDERGCGFFFRMNGRKCDGDDFLLGKCPKICGFCAPCGDKDRKCGEWAAAGKCEAEPIQMFPKCNQSCQLC